MFYGWNRHPEYEGKHAFLGASQHAWTRYNDETLRIRYFNSFQTEIGTAVHELAQHLIMNRIRLNMHNKNMIEFWLSGTPYRFPRESYDAQKILQNLIPFVDDAIGFHMTPEVLLFYSPECFGTTDAIAVDEVNKILRIHDYKNGVTPASMGQPLVYAALFFLEYGKQFDPKQYKVILRIYQNCEINECTPSYEDIANMMDLIKDRVYRLQEMKGVRI